MSPKPDLAVIGQTGCKNDSVRRAKAGTERRICRFCPLNDTHIGASINQKACDLPTKRAMADHCCPLGPIQTSSSVLG